MEGTIIKFAVSWSCHGRCGNATFDTKKELEEHIEKNKSYWSSFSRWWFKPSWDGISYLNAMDK